MTTPTFKFGTRDINPLIVSTITWERGSRGLGIADYVGRRAVYCWAEIHPYKARLNRKYHKTLPWYLRMWGCTSDSSVASWSPPRVKIFGSNGECIGSMRCRSNANAEKIYNEIRAEWQEKLAFFTNLPK